MPIKPYPRPSGIYHLRGAHLGVRVDRSSGTRSLEHARILAAKEEAEIFERHAYGEKAVCTFAEAASGYIRGGGEAEFLTPLIERFGLKKLSALSQSDLDTAATEIMPAASGATRRRKIYTPFIATWNWAVADRKAEPRKWKRPPDGKKKLDWLTPDDAERLLEALPVHARGIATFYLGTGARASEALNTVWSEISPAAQRVQLWADITKAGADRFVDLGSRVADALPARRAGGEPVFVNSFGEPWHAYDAINLTLRRASDKAGLQKRAHCHMLRHTWATWAYALTKDLPKLMQQGGWASAELALRYAHAGDDVADGVRKHGWELLGKQAPAPKRKLKRVS